MKFGKITIVGVGLIGGSIGLAVKKRRLAKVVCGVGRRMASLKNAKRAGAVDIGTLDLETGVKDADLIIIATPISLMPQYASRIAAMPRLLKKGLIITDTGSTKEFIVSKLGAILSGRAHFVGSHPFAGSEKSGVINASEDLFCRTKTFLTPSGRTDKSALARVKGLWQALGSEVVLISPARHDKIAAGISHLPHLAAAALVNSVSPGEMAVASSGFSDTTRIAAGDCVMWRDICLSNPKNILKAIGRFQRSLAALSKAVKDRDANALIGQLAAAKKKREKL